MMRSFERIRSWILDQSTSPLSVLRAPYLSSITQMPAVKRDAVHRPANLVLSCSLGRFLTSSLRMLVSRRYTG